MTKPKMRWYCVEYKLSTGSKSMMDYDLIGGKIIVMAKNPLLAINNASSTVVTKTHSIFEWINIYRV